MDASPRESMPPEFDWTHPESGMFLWVTCPEGVDTNELIREALVRKVQQAENYDLSKLS